MQGNGCVTTVLSKDEQSGRGECVSLYTDVCGMYVQLGAYNPEHKTYAIWKNINYASEWTNSFSLTHLSPFSFFLISLMIFQNKNEYRKIDAYKAHRQ